MALTVGILGIGSNTALARLASNRLAGNRLGANKFASNKLASNRLASNGLTVDASGAGDLLATSDGRDVL